MKYIRRLQLISLVALAMDGGGASASRLRSNRSVVLPTTTHDIRGGTSSQAIATKSIDSIKRQTLNTLHQTSFLMVAATSMVVFAPLPSLTAYLERSISTTTTTTSNTNNMTPQAKAVQILSILSAVSAAIELFLSPLVGVVIDTFGRKLPMSMFASVIAVANLGVVLHPSIVTICISRMVNVLLGGFLVIIANAVIADLFTTSTSNSKNDKGSEQMGGVLGRQAATVSLGFLFGSVAGGRLTEYGERIAYGSALIFSTLATLNTFRMRDSLQFSRDTDTSKSVSSTSKTSTTEDSKPRLFSQESANCIKEKLIEAPLSSIQLLYVYGKRMRTLALLLMLQSIPIYMGDVFQMFAKEEWGLNPKDFANIVALFGILGIVSNMSLPLVLESMGLRTFSLFAILSSLLFPLAAIFTNSYRLVLLAGCIGLYGGVQKVRICITFHLYRF